MAETVFIVVGDEILGGFTQDTNSAYLARRLREAGWGLSRITVIPDDVSLIAATVSVAVQNPSLRRIVVGGGVGPTPDDRTYEGVAAALARPLRIEDSVLRHIATRIALLHAAGRLPSAEVSAPNRRMAELPEGAQVLLNDDGMAPLAAFRLEGDDRWLFTLPGVPREFERLVDEALIPRYFGDGTVLGLEEIELSGIPESRIADPMRRVMGEFPGISVGSYPQRERRRLILRVQGADPAAVRDAAMRLRTLVAELGREP